MYVRVRVQPKRVTWTLFSKETVNIQEQISILEGYVRVKIPPPHSRAFIIKFELYYYFVVVETNKSKGRRKKKYLYPETNLSCVWPWQKNREREEREKKTILDGEKEIEEDGGVEGNNSDLVIATLCMHACMHYDRRPT